MSSSRARASVLSRERALALLPNHLRSDENRMMTVSAVQHKRETTRPCGVTGAGFMPGQSGNPGGKAEGPEPAGAWALRT